MIALLWVLVLGGGALLAQNWLDKRKVARAPTWITDEYGQAAYTIQADRYSQYLFTGSVNGNDIDFLLDTGASEISIPGGIAKRLDLRRGKNYIVTTANGNVTVYATQLESITVGPFTLRNISAHINPAMEGDVALLGMNFLRHFEILQRAGVLTISIP